VQQLPDAFLNSLEGVKGFEKESFIKVHDSGEQVTSIRINPLKISGNDFSFERAEKIPWTKFGYYLNKRPSFTFDPLFHAGCYYVQEASSMFLEEALQQTVDLSQPIKVLDTCASPGGKSTHIQSLISAESLLVSNEVIKPRAGVLKQNIIKWGSNNVIVTNNDPKHFQKLEGFFDVIVVDAPCSGSGLFRKDIDAISEWSLDNVQLCCGRQQRILADILPALKENGVLIYSTCSYSKEEDEDIMDWLGDEMQMENLPLRLAENSGIIATESKKNKATGYRFYPDKIKGEGFFIACFKKKQIANAKRYKPGKPNLISAKEKEVINAWVDKADQLSFMRHENFVFAWPQFLLEDFILIQALLYIQYAGTNLGELIRDKLIPDHALAMSPLVSKNINRTELDYETAIKYLQRGDLSVNTDMKGWGLVTFKNHPLGWVNALPNRINNYYPKEFRILKQYNGSPFEK
jgi:16S rRNA C967 or C1407 C5-methylase (RsmB/RsmF family)/NOL1/NOP2/fmu family ribosome biogenesis protein